VLPALITTLLFALTAVCATQSSIPYGPERANLGRLAIAVVLLGGWAHLLGSGLGGGRLAILMLAGTIGFGGGGWCMFQAFPRLGSTLSLLAVECAAAVVALVLGVILFGAHISLIQMVFIACTLGGVVLALGPFRVPKVRQEVLLTGIGFTILAAIGQGISWTLTKSAFIYFQERAIEVDSLTAAYQRLLGGFCFAILIVLISLARKGSGYIQSMTSDYIRSKGQSCFHPSLWVLGNALAGPVLGVSCMLWAIRQVDNPGVVQTIVATATLFTVPLARRLENRVFHWNYFTGFGIALIGVAGLVATISH